MNRILFLFILFVFAFFSCTEHDEKIRPSAQLTSICKNANHPKASMSSFEKNLINAGLVDVLKMDSSLKVDLKYSSTDNFFGTDVYGNFNKCYLQKDAAEKLIAAQHKLQALKPSYSLIVWDAARPRSVQQLMWDTLKMPFNEKIKFLSNPKLGSQHNFGEAVDLSILNDKQQLLDMGTAFDYIGELAYTTIEARLLAEGKLSKEQYDNRKLLRSVMNQSGFYNIQTEWWHFNACSWGDAAKQYKIIE